MLDTITTWLEVVGLVLLAIAAGLQALTWSLPGALAVCGALLIAEAALISWRSRPRPEPIGDQTA